MSLTLRLILAAALLVLAGCDDNDAEATQERVRAIKTYVVAEPAGGDTRRFSGSLSAAATSALSFAVSGTVQTVEAAQGDAVSAGQALATLDPEPFRLDVQAARAEVAAIQAEFTEKRSVVQRQRTLFEKGWVAQAAVDQAVAAFNAADGQLNLTRSRLGTAERNLANTTLTAPFDGLIASRDIEPFQEVAAGTPVFQINADGAMEVDVSVPDRVVGRIAPGAPVSIDVPTVPGCGCKGRIAEIGVASGAANAVTVTAVLTEASEGLLPGMAAEVSIVLAGMGESQGFLVPITAIAPGDDDTRGYVFVFDEEAGIVRKTPIVAGTGVLENLVAVADGVSAGDVVAAAGVSFLRDGQSVKLLDD